MNEKDSSPKKSDLPLKKEYQITFKGYLKEVSSELDYLQVVEDLFYNLGNDTTKDKEIEVGTADQITIRFKINSVNEEAALDWTQFLFEEAAHKLGGKSEITGSGVKITEISKYID